MESRSKSNNLVAILIALILIAIGFALAFIHQRSESDEKAAEKSVTLVLSAVSERDPTSA